ncbi:MAG TPA: TonB-dependent receptor plug domain-containing protein [Candidatus Kryptobacter bacterium]|nr:TonB-dependent receptor plug domain-containing protein [Candidatus Kryptobacter bacterium]
MKELPDANIAESIGRLPGVSLQRDNGEADAVIIRGMAPKYNEVEIEGVPMSSTYWGDRGIDLSLLGDELVAGVTVSKTLTANINNHIDSYYYSHPTYVSGTNTYNAGQLPTSEQTYSWNAQLGLTFSY